MKKLLLSSLLVSSLSVAAVTPTFANVSDVTSTTPPTTKMTVRQQTEGYGYNPNVFTPGTVNRTITNGTNRNNDLNPFNNNGMTANNGNRVDLNPFNNNGNGVDLNPFDRDNNNGINNRVGTYGTYDRTRMNMNGVRTNNVGTNNGIRTNNYRATATTTTNRGFSWGWLGLLGLFGLAGMRSRSRDDVR